MDRKRLALRTFHYFEVGINILLVLNLLAALLLTDATIRDYWGPAIDFFCDISIVIFIIEILARILKHPTRQGMWSYFRSNGHWNSWNIFDLIITAISALTLYRGMASIVSLRTLRLLKLASTSKVILRQPALQRLTAAIFASMSAIMGACLYILFLTTLYAIIGVNLYREIAPEYFGTLGHTYLTLFQLMIFDDWGNIVRPLVEERPFSWLYAVSFTIFASFVLMNLIVGFLVDTIQDLRIRRELRSRHGLLHESDQLQEQLERFETAFHKWEEQVKRKDAQQGKSS